MGNPIRQGSVWADQTRRVLRTHLVWSVQTDPWWAGSPYNLMLDQKDWSICARFWLRSTDWLIDWLTLFAEWNLLQKEFISATLILGKCFKTRSLEVLINSLLRGLTLHLHSSKSLSYNWIRFVRKSSSSDWGCESEFKFHYQLSKKSF